MEGHLLWRSAKLLLLAGLCNRLVRHELLLLCVKGLKRLAEVCSARIQLLRALSLLGSLNLWLVELLLIELLLISAHAQVGHHLT